MNSNSAVWIMSSITTDGEQSTTCEKIWDSTDDEESLADGPGLGWISPDILIYIHISVTTGIELRFLGEEFHARSKRSKLDNYVSRTRFAGAGTKACWFAESVTSVDLRYIYVDAEILGNPEYYIVRVFIALFDNTRQPDAISTAVLFGLICLCFKYRHPVLKKRILFLKFSDLCFQAAQDTINNGRN
ncbi:hypothetical protein DPMN_165933 [Dreissena polymorpha]|uniref:Uncharacterized protein n=1 Tax=Dreissena polymorpha TaxID=45954 RepID=A0A9D4IWX6_DREPO|nr:hypothetical protein DPMN_165933 [Dreissena polymorpha]